MNKKITKAEFAKSLEESVKWLWEKKCGCCHWCFLTDDKKRRWSVVLGWNEGGYEESDNDELYVSEGFAISYKIGYEEPNNAMQTDMDWDFIMPYDEETGDVDDTCSAVYRNTDYSKLADELLETFKRITDKWAYFEPEEKEEVA